MSKVAEEDWSVRCIIENNVIIFLLTSATAISIPWFMYRYIKERPKKMTTTSPLYKGGLIYFIINLIFFTVGATGTASFCSHSQFYVGIQFFNSMIYGIQYGVLLLLLFMRCYYVFHGTAYQLSRRVVITYVALYIILLLGVMFSLVFYVSVYGDTIINNIISFVTFLAIISLNVILVYLFISKLLDIQKAVNKANDDEQNLRFFSTVIKATILTLLSILTTITFALVVNLVDEEGEWVFFIGLFLNFDVLTNYLSFLLGYSQFAENYRCLCGRCDKGCKSVCNMQAVQMTANEVHSEDASPSADGTGVESNDIESN